MLIMRAGSHDAKLAYLGGHNFEPVVSKLGLGSVTEVVYDFVFTPPASTNRGPEFGFCRVWTSFVYRVVCF